MPCKQLAAAVAARGEAMAIVTYPDTYHDFDDPGLASNPEAREDAKKRVLSFLAETLQ